MKLQMNPNLTAEATVFQALTRNEIVVNTNLGGRSTYQNAGRTKPQRRRAGAGLSVRRAVPAQFAYTYVDATYEDAYRTCVGPPCAIPTVLVDAGTPPAGRAEEQRLRESHVGDRSSAGTPA